MRFRELLSARLLIAGIAITAGLATRADAPKLPKPADFQVMIETSVEVVSKTVPKKFGGRALGRCLRDEKAGPFEWIVQFDGGEGERHVMVLLYAPPSSGTTDQMSLMVATSAGTAAISTMKGAAPTGKGRLTVTRSGKRAQLVVTGVSADGAKISVKIDCESTTAE